MGESFLDESFLEEGVDNGPPALRVGAVSLVTVKLELLEFPPAGLTTVIKPVMAPGGTVAEIELSAVMVNVDDTPLNFTAVVPVKFSPTIMTVVPTRPLVGVKFRT